MQSITNKNQTILEIAAKGPGTFYSSGFENRYWKGVRFTGTCSVATEMTSLTVTLQEYDPSQDAYIDVTGAVFVAWEATGSKMLTIYPSLTAAVNAVVVNHLGRKFRFKYVIVGVGALVTFKLNAMYLR